jgi:hypothetical protein
VIFLNTKNFYALIEDLHMLDEFIHQWFFPSIYISDSSASEKRYGRNAESRTVILLGEKQLQLFLLLSTR